MGDYDYGNARLRAMKSRLLSRRDLETLSESGSLEGLAAALTRTAYRPAVESALAQATGVEVLDLALRTDLRNTLVKLRSFFSGDAGEMAAIALGAYDIDNLQAILRGQAHNAPAADILAAVLPAGDLSYPILADLARLHSPREVIDLLASQMSPLAHPLLRLRMEHPGADTFEMEVALAQWRFTSGFEALKEAKDGGQMSSFLILEADITNLLTILRFAHTPGERKLLRERTGSEDLTRLLVGPGRIPFPLLVQAGMQEAPAAAVEVLSRTPYAPVLQAGLESFHRSGRLSDFETHLKRYRLKWMAGLTARDPLGPGVLLSYLALKLNEIANLRRIGLGIRMGLQPGTIRASLEYVV